MSKFIEELEQEFPSSIVSEVSLKTIGNRWQETVDERLNKGFTHFVDDGYTSYFCYSVEHANETKQALDVFAETMKDISRKYHQE